MSNNAPEAAYYSIFKHPLTGLTAWSEFPKPRQACRLGENYNPHSHSSVFKKKKNHYKPIHMYILHTHVRGFISVSFFLGLLHVFKPFDPPRATASIPRFDFNLLGSTWKRKPSQDATVSTERVLNFRQGELIPRCHWFIPWLASRCVWEPAFSFHVYFGETGREQPFPFASKWH